MLLASKILQELLQSIAPDMEVLEEARKRRDLVMKAAMQFEGAYKKILSGSVAHGTVIFKVSDADGALVINLSTYPDLTPDGDGGGPEDIVKAMADFIRPILQDDYPDVWIRTARKRSILIDFREEIKDEQDPTVDLIVAFNRKDKPGLWIPNLDSNTWNASDPEKHTQLVAEAHKATDGASTRCIRLGKLYLKQWNPDLLFSFNITVLAVQCITEKMEIGEAFAQLLSCAAESIEKGNTSDPAGVSAPIKIPEQYTRSKIVSSLKEAAGYAEDAIDPDADIESVAESLGKIFWQHKDLIEEAAKKIEVEEAMRSGSIGVRSGAFVSAGAAARSVIPTTAFGGTAIKPKKTWGKSGPWFANEKERFQFERGLIGSTGILTM